MPLLFFPSVHGGAGNRYTANMCAPDNNTFCYWPEKHDAHVSAILMAHYSERFNSFLTWCTGQRATQNHPCSKYSWTPTQQTELIFPFFWMWVHVYSNKIRDANLEGKEKRPSSYMINALFSGSAFPQIRWYWFYWTHHLLWNVDVCVCVCKCDVIYMLHTYACGRLVTSLCVCVALSGWVGKCMHGNVILSAPHIRSGVCVVLYAQPSLTFVAPYKRSKRAKDDRLWLRSILSFRFPAFRYQI